MDDHKGASLGAPARRAANDAPAPDGRAWRAEVLRRPELVLDDPELMGALVGAQARALGGNVVDLRSMALARSEGRLAKLEAAHREVIAAAYDNLAGASQVHRAALVLLRAEGIGALLEAVTDAFPRVLRIEAAHVALESHEHVAPHPALRAVPPGTVDSLVGARGAADAPRVRLRPRPAGGDPALHGASAAGLRSEALIRLELGQTRSPGLLALGAVEPERFRAGQGTDLLAFLGMVLEVLLRRRLAGLRPSMHVAVPAPR